jgi:hypothetical protein
VGRRGVRRQGAGKGRVFLRTNVSPTWARDTKVYRQKVVWCKIPTTSHETRVLAFLCGPVSKVLNKHVVATGALTA